MRFDSIVYRMKLAPTITSARQLINHGHFNVNQKKVNIPSYQCQISDEISVRLKSKHLINALRHGSTKIDPNKQEQSLNAISNDKKLPMHLILDEQRLTGTISKIISLKDPIIEQYYQDLKLKPLYIIEFYSRQL